MVYCLTDKEERQLISELVKQPLFYFITLVVSASALMTWQTPAALAATTVFALILCSLSLVDLETMTLPDLLTLPGMIFGLILSPLFLEVTWINSTLGAVIGFGAFWLLFWGYIHLRGHEGMGYGDIKLLGLLGAWTGATGILPTLLIATFSAMIAFLARRVIYGTHTREPLPFGPFLALGGWLTLLFHDDIWQTIIDSRQLIINFILGA